MSPQPRCLLCDQINVSKNFVHYHMVFASLCTDIRLVFIAKRQLLFYLLKKWLADVNKEAIFEVQNGYLIL